MSSAPNDAPPAARGHLYGRAAPPSGPLANLVHQPLLAATRRALDALDAPTADAVLAAGAPLWTSSEWLRAYVVAEVNASHAEPEYAPRVSDPNTHESLFQAVNIMDHPWAKLSAGVTSPHDFNSRRRGRSAHPVARFTGRLIATQFLSATPIEIQRWRCTPFNDETDPRGIRSEAGDVEVVQPGTVLVVDGTRESISFRRIEAALVVVQLQVSDRVAGCSMAVLTDAGTGQFVRVEPTEASGSRVRTYAAALRALGANGREPALNAFLGHSSFFVRWQVMRELVALQGRAALPRLETFLAAERNPLVREAAEQTLQLLSRP